MQLTQEQKDIIKANLDKYFKSNNYDGFFKEAARGELYPYAHFFTDVVGRDMLRLMKEIPRSLYENDPELKYVKIPGNIETVGERAFKNCSALKQVVFEDGVKTIGPNCFANCTNLEAVKLPEGLTAIPMNCFRGCTSIKRIDIPSTVKNFGAGAFSGCSDDIVIAMKKPANAADRPRCKKQDVEWMHDHLAYIAPKAQPATTEPAPAQPEKEA